MTTSLAVGETSSVAKPDLKQKATGNPAKTTQGPKGSKSESSSSMKVIRPRQQISIDYWVEHADLETAVSFYRAEWNELVSLSVDRNVFNEPWYIEAAAQQLEDIGQLEFAFVYHREKNPAEKPYLCGVFPYVIGPGYNGISGLKHASLWTTPFSYNSQPHLREGYGVAALCTFIDWMRQAYQKVAILEFHKCPGDGHFRKALNEIVQARTYTMLENDNYNRALIENGGDAEKYLTSAIDHHQLKELRRKRRRLEEQGKFEVRELLHESELPIWIENFMELELKGWKGAQQTALKQNAHHENFARRMITSAFNHGQLEMFGFFLNDQPIALKCNLTTGHGAYAFKIAYDEAYAKYSPGVMLELEMIQRLQTQSQVEWIDSCACSQHPMIDRLWKERRTIQTLLIPLDRFWGPLAIGSKQIAKTLKRILKPKKSDELVVRNF
jgi:hypothetical protein